MTTKTGLPPPVAKPKIDFSHLAEQDRSTQRARAALQIPGIIRELQIRLSDSLRIYEPLPTQESFHASKVRVRLIRGGNRGGKTLAVAAEIARAVRRLDPHKKYPDSGVVYMVGKSWEHIRDTIWPKLCVPGAFKVIRDRTTREMRAFRPWDPADLARSKEAKKADPLIPRRILEDISWYKKRDRTPALVTLKTGWKIVFFSGNAEPPQGSDIDIGWLDEEIPHSQWLPELNSRILDRNGCLIWSATPEVGTEQFYDLCSKAQEQALLPAAEREIEEHFITLMDNPHISEQAKAGMGSALSEQELEVKKYGQFASAGRVIFPEYSKITHGLPSFEIPDHWTFYAAIDPGYQIGSCLLGAVPDPSAVIDDPYDLLLWEEIYIVRCTAKKMATKLVEILRGRELEDMVIDMTMARQHEVGSGMTIYEHYAEEFASHGIHCRRRGHGFAQGLADVKASIAVCRDYLISNPVTGAPRVRVFCTEQKNENRVVRSPLLPNFEWEIQRWKYRVIAGQATDEPETRGRNHLMHCLRYLCSHKPSFHVQKTRVRDNHPMAQLARLERFIAARTARPPGGPLVFGPAGSTA